MNSKKKKFSLSLRWSSRPSGSDSPDGPQAKITSLAESRTGTRGFFLYQLNKRHEVEDDKTKIKDVF